jgi:hypothetical protein
MAAAVVIVGVGGVGVEDTTVATARWAVPLASATSRSDRFARVYGGIVDTVNISFRVPACPLLIWRCVRWAPLPQERQTPPIRTRDGDPSIWGDHLPYTPN